MSCRTNILSAHACRPFRLVFFPRGRNTPRRQDNHTLYSRGAVSPPTGERGGDREGGRELGILVLGGEGIRNEGAGFGADASNFLHTQMSDCDMAL